VGGAALCVREAPVVQRISLQRAFRSVGQGGESERDQVVPVGGRIKRAPGSKDLGLPRRHYPAAVRLDCLEDFLEKGARTWTKTSTRGDDNDSDEKGIALIVINNCRSSMHPLKSSSLSAPFFLVFISIFNCVAHSPWLSEGSKPRWDQQERQNRQKELRVMARKKRISTQLYAHLVQLYDICIAR
jgi:hypothetical protein